FRLSCGGGGDIHAKAVHFNRGKELLVLMLPIFNEPRRTKGIQTYLSHSKILDKGIERTKLKSYGCPWRAQWSAASRWFQRALLRGRSLRRCHHRPRHVR